MSSEEKFNCQWIGQVIINHETQKGVRSKHASIAAVNQCRALIDAPLLLHASVTIWIHCYAGKQATAEPDLWHFRERPQRFWVFISQPQASLNEELNFSLLQRTENHQKKKPKWVQLWKGREQNNTELLSALSASRLSWFAFPRSNMRRCLSSPATHTHLAELQAAAPHDRSPPRGDQSSPAAETRLQL